MFKTDESDVKITKADCDKIRAASGSNSAVMPGYVKMPSELTAENGAKGLLVGEFFETVESECEECAHKQLPDDCKYCDGTGYVVDKIPVGWDTIKEIYKMAVKHLGT